MRLREEGAATVRVALDSMRKGLKDTAKDSSKLDNELKGLSNQFKTLASSIAAAAGGAAALKAIDTYASMNNQLKLAAGSSEEFAKAQAAVIRIAQQTNQPIENVAELYAKTARSAAALGISQTDIAKMTQTVSQALIVSGSDAGAASGALQQLGQALAAGTVRAEEFNSIMDGAPALIQAVEKDLGLATGGLRKLALEGKLSSDIFAQAIIRNNSVAEQFGKMVPTLAQQVAGLRNQFVLLTGRIAETTGVTSTLGNAIAWLKNNLPTVVGLVGSLTAAFVAYRAAMIGAAVASAALTAAETIAGFFSLAKAVRSLADASALMSLVTGGWVKALAVVASVAAGYASFDYIQRKLSETMAGLTAQISDQADRTAYLGKVNASIHPVLQKTAAIKLDNTVKGKTYIEMLAELAGITTITTSQHKALTTEATRLSVALTASNLTMAKRLELAKQLQTVETALGNARVKLTLEESAAKLKASAGTFGAPTGPTRGFTVANIDPATLAGQVNKGIAPALDATRAAFVAQMTELGAQMDQEITNVLGNALASGIENAIATGSIGEGFKSVAAALLGGLGDIVQRLGVAMLPVAALMQKLMESMASLNPYAMAAAAVGLIALGASMKGIARRAVGGVSSGTAAMGGTIGGLGISGGGTVTTRQFGTTMAGAASQSVAPVQPMNVTIIGPNDPNAQRQIATLMDNAARRGLVQGSQLRTV